MLGWKKAHFHHVGAAGCDGKILKSMPPWRRQISRICSCGKWEISRWGLFLWGFYTPKTTKKSRENRSMFHGFRTYPAWSPSVKQQNIRKATKRIGADRWVDASWHGGHISSWLVSGPPLNNSYTLCKVGCQKTPPQKTYDPAFKTIPHLSI